MNDQKNEYFRKKIRMNKDSIRKTFSVPQKKSVFRLILGRKICILQNFKVKKSVYTDKISMSGRSEAAGIISKSILSMMFASIY